MDSNENKIGIRKLPAAYPKNGNYEQHYFDTMEQAQAFVDEDWEKENRNYNVAYLVAKPTDTWYYAIVPKAFSWKVWNELSQ